jgi:hypothetical protein
MKRTILLAVSIAAIAVTAGCGGGGSGGGSGAAQRQPGQWESVTTIKSIDIPGAPPQVLQQVQAQVGQAQTQRECLTAEQTRDPMAQMRRMLSQGNTGNCNFTDQVFAGGTIRIRGTCNPPGGGSAQVSLEGSFTATTLEANLTMNAQGPAGAAMPGVTSMNMTAEVRGRRIGDCPGGAAAPAGNPM